MQALNLNPLGAGNIQTVEIDLVNSSACELQVTEIIVQYLHSSI
jgi:hypothetical protein